MKLHERFTDEVMRPAGSYDEEAAHFHQIEDQIMSLTAAAEPLPEPGPPPAYEPPATPLTPILPAATVTLDELVRIERAWRREVKNVIIPELERVMREAADSVLKDIATQAPVLWDVSQPSAQAFLVQTENQLVGVGEDMWKRTRDELIMGMQEGDSIQQLSARVKGVLGSTDARARTIARTEVIGASNAGAMQQLELLGPDFMPQRKTWVSTHDKRTRLSHAVADGQTVDFVAPFTVGGAKLDYPGDPDAPAEERINCRCTLVWHFDDVPLKDELTSAGPLEMFGKAGDPYVRDSHGRFAPKGGGGGGASAPTGSKKVLKPANVDTSRLNAAEAKELADIEADYKAGKIDAAKYKYKTYYVKVKASKRINKSGGVGKGTELDTGAKPKISYAPSSGFKEAKPLGPSTNKPTVNISTTNKTGLNIGESVDTPAGKGKVIDAKGDLVTIKTADGGKHTYPSYKVGKTKSDIEEGDVVQLPSGKTGVVVGKVKGTNSVLVDTPDGDSLAIHTDHLTKPGDVKTSDVNTPEKHPTPPWKQPKTGDIVSTPSGEGKVISESSDYALVEHPDGSTSMHKKTDITKSTKVTQPGDKVKLPDDSIATVQSVNDKSVIVKDENGVTDIYMHEEVGTTGPKAPISGKLDAPKPAFDAPSGNDKVVLPSGATGTVVKKQGKTLTVKTPDGKTTIIHESQVKKPSSASGESTPKPKKEFIKPSQVKETQLNDAEYKELYDLTTANKAGTLSDAEYKKKAYYVKVKASKRINKNNGVTKDNPVSGGVSTGSPGVKSNPPVSALVPNGPATGLVTGNSPDAKLPAVLGDPKSATRAMAHKNADITQKTALKRIQEGKMYGGTNSAGLSAHSTYTGSGYTPMNNYARTGKTKIHPYDYSSMTDAQAAKKIKALDSVFDTHGVELGQPIVLNRGVRGKYAASLKNDLKPGDIITERGFISTSSKRSAPKSFKSTDGVLLEIAVPPGKKVIAGTDYESELILPRNQQLLYHGKTSDGVLQFSVL